MSCIHGFKPVPAVLAEQLDTSPTGRFVAVKKWGDGGESIMQFFPTQRAALAWIAKQRHPRNDEFEWCVGEFA